MRVLKQPLVYFVLLGAVVFVVDSWLRRAADSVDVTEAVRQEIASELQRVHARAPTDQELAQGVQEWRDTELLYREALRLGLDRDDPQLKAHLATKLKNLVKQRAIVAPPTEQELLAEFTANKHKYTRPNTFDVTVVFVNKSVEPETHEARVDAIAAKVAAGADPATAGDHFPRGAQLQERLPVQLQQILQTDLSHVLDAERTGTWQRIPSSRGTFLFRLDKINGGEPVFESIKTSLGNELEQRKRDEAFGTFTAELRARYSVETTNSTD